MKNDLVYDILDNLNDAAWELHQYEFHVAVSNAILALEDLIMMDESDRPTIAELCSDIKILGCIKVSPPYRAGTRYSISIKKGLAEEYSPK